VVVHTARDSRLREAVAAAENHPDVEMLARFGDDYLYRIR